MIVMGAFDSSRTLLNLGAAFAGTITVAANLIALVWFGMWMGLNSTNTNLATLKTIVFVQIIPWFVISFASAMLLPILMMIFSSASSGIMMWYSFLTQGLAAVLYLGK